MSDETRFVAVLLHPKRSAALVAAATFIAGMAKRNIGCLVFPDDVDRLRANVPQADIRPINTHIVELAVVFGGDGSILRAAEWAQPQGIPLLGVNLGHVGFLAELEPSDIDILTEQVAKRNYSVEERFTLKLAVVNQDGERIWQSNAVNEISLEKNRRFLMVGVQVKIDGRPVSNWNCDGLLVSTPTGSTAYAFSAGGPVIWPDVQGFLVMPVAAHALFARPLVLGPESTVELELINNYEQEALLWCDGRRKFELHLNQRVTVVRGDQPLKIARLSEQPFTTRLVKKFQLPISGWGSAPKGQNAN